MTSPLPLPLPLPSLTSPNGVVSHRSATHGGGPTTSCPHATSELVRKRGGFIDIPKKLSNNCYGTSQQKLTKLLLNVNIQNSLGPVQVVVSSENTVRDLVKAAVDVYVKEKRRPLLVYTDPQCFELHYSAFSLESLKPEAKLINLGSRNFFCCPKPSNGANSSWSEEAFPFPVTRFMDFLL